MEELEFEMLHIYAQYSEHGEAIIIADKNSLKHLRDAIKEAIETGHGETTGFVSDGESFACHVACVDFPEDKESLLAVPYTSDLSKESRSEAIAPQVIVREMISR